MIVDFQHHFTPRELIKEDPGDRLILHYDAQGAPSYTIHRLLYDLDEHVAMMDLPASTPPGSPARRACAPISKPRVWSTTRPRRPRRITPAASSAPRTRTRSAAPTR